MARLRTSKSTAKDVAYAIKERVSGNKAVTSFKENGREAPFGKAGGESRSNLEGMSRSFTSHMAGLYTRNNLNKSCGDHGVSFR